MRLPANPAHPNSLTCSTGRRARASQRKLRRGRRDYNPGPSLPDRERAKLRKQPEAEAEFFAAQAVALPTEAASWTTWRQYKATLDTLATADAPIPPTPVTMSKLSLFAIVGEARVPAKLHQGEAVRHEAALPRA